MLSLGEWMDGALKRQWGKGNWIELEFMFEQLTSTMKGAEGNLMGFISIEH
jgi:hypothetical protein